MMPVNVFAKVEALTVALQQAEQEGARLLTIIDEMKREQAEVAAILDAANEGLDGLQSTILILTKQRDEAREWVRRMTRDTQTLTCVYCGHAYPPGTPAHGSDVLTAHIEQCEKHPTRRLVQERDRERARADKAEAALATAREKVKGLLQRFLYHPDTGSTEADPDECWLDEAEVLAALGIDA